MLLSIENVLSQKQVAECRQHLEQAAWQDGRNTAGGIAANVKANQQLDDNAGAAQSLSPAIIDIIKQHPLFISAALPNKIYPPKFNRYQQAGHYGLHVDSAVMLHPSGEQMRTDLSATLFLSSPDEYQGGELIIETHYGAQTVKLSAGDVILYPSHSLHEVKPVTQGVRYASFFWVQSLVADMSQREKLFDLDQSIQALTIELGASHLQVQKLTQIYHNLLRQWTVC